MQVRPRFQAADFPKVDRTLKGDRLVVAASPAIEPEAGLPDEVPSKLEDPAASNASVKGMKAASERARRSIRNAGCAERAAAAAIRRFLVARITAARRSQGVAGDAFGDDRDRAAADGFNIRTSSLFFGSSSLGGSLGASSAGAPAKSRS